MGRYYKKGMCRGWGIFAVINDVDIISNCLEIKEIRKGSAGNAGPFIFNTLWFRELYKRTMLKALLRQLHCRQWRHRRWQA